MRQPLANLLRPIQHQLDADPDLKRDSRLLISIPGIAFLTAAKCLAYLGDYTRFRSADQLVAYARLCPSHFTSGTSIHAPPRLSKRGNAALRQALYMPAVVALTRNPRIHAQAERLRAKHKASLQIVAAAMHKLLRIVWGVLHPQTPFFPQGNRILIKKDFE